MKKRKKEGVWRKWRFQKQIQLKSLESSKREWYYCTSHAVILPLALCQTHVWKIEFEMSVEWQKYRKTLKPKNVKFDTKVKKRIISGHCVVSSKTFWYTTNHLFRLLWKMFSMCCIYLVYLLCRISSSHRCFPILGWHWRVASNAVGNVASIGASSQPNVLPEARHTQMHPYIPLQGHHFVAFNTFVRQRRNRTQLIKT